MPPFGNDEERVWLETKAAVAAAVDDSFTFEDYLKYHEVLELKEVGAKVMTMPDSQSLLDYIEQQLELLETKETTFVKLPRKKWKMAKWTSIGLSVLLIPALLFAITILTTRKAEK